ncbi:MAG: hypothetical protein Kow0074_06440 [Candidatus Zixiibacteriota bacterium]
MSDTVDHEYWQSQIPDYLQRRLKESELAAFRAHISGCAMCRESLAEAVALTEGLQALAREAQATHPDSELLVRFASDPSALSVLDRDLIEEHLPLCSSCQSAIATARSVLKDAQMSDVARASDLTTSRGTPPTWFRTLWHPAAGYAVAALLLIALGVPALKSVQRPSEQLEEITAAPTSPLLPQTRGGFRAQIIERSPGDELVRLVVFSEIPIQGDFDAMLLDSAGTIAAAVRGTTPRPTSYLNVSLSARTLNDGTYTLRLVSHTTSGGEQTIEYPFKLSTVRNP